MIEKEEWTEVEAPSSDNEENKVEFEVEEESKTEATSDTEPPKEEKKEPQELEGIETKGAQKRIRQLIKQRKDRDDQISQLIRNNEDLVGTSPDRKSTRLNSSHIQKSRMPSSA